MLWSSSGHWLVPPKGWGHGIGSSRGCGSRLLGTKDDCFAFSKLIHMSGWYQICVARNLQEGIHLNGQSGDKGHWALCVGKLFCCKFFESLNQYEKNRAIQIEIRKTRACLHQNQKMLLET